jgi:bifunctional ADP-heptose synthase (sugar kinase/adenylyltransferase)
MKNVLSAANTQVAQLMSEGYMISFGDSSFGYAFRVDLQNGESFVRVKVENEHDFENGDQIVLSVVEIAEADGFESKDAVVRFEKTWFVVDDKRKDFGRHVRDYVLTDNEEERKTIKETRRNRYRAQVARKAVDLTPSTALIRMLKKRKGFSNATRANITVQRVKTGYQVKMAGRNGGADKVEVIRLPRASC